MRRLFIIRKDLHLTAGKLAAMVGHCSEAYFTNLLKREFAQAKKDWLAEDEEDYVSFPIYVDRDVWEGYVNGIFTKTILEAKNRNKLMAVVDMAKELNLKEGLDFGLINDKCLTELAPENEDGTTTVGIWFKPLPDEIAHQISYKYKLYRD